MNYPQIDEIHDGSTTVEGFIDIGNRFFNRFTTLGNLLPTDNILDIGCCIGRMAIPLINYLTTGKYNGFDIMKDGVDWCSTNITPDHPNFIFNHANIYNVLYNPTSPIKVKDYVFPYEDNSFNFVTLTSVFTHMMDYEIEHYMKEIERVLSKNGRLFISMFLINKDSKQLMLDNKGPWKFLYKANENTYCNIPNATGDVGVTAYEEGYITNLLEKHNFVGTAIYGGEWCGRSDFTCYQDIIVATKK